jgi:hypothetical protein
MRQAKEQPMAETTPSPTTDESGLEEMESAAQERPKNEKRDVPPPPSTAHQLPESRTKGMLQDAIQKVMDEIAYHEQEAKSHLQQAEALRRDLRDSFAFLQGREGKGKPTGTGREDATPRVAEPDMAGKAEAVPVARQQRGKRRSKRAARKGKET